MMTVLNIICVIIAAVAWFFCGYFTGKRKVYNEWSDWLDRMSEIQKGWKNGRESSDD